MPIYEYKCGNCGNIFEVEHEMKEDPKLFKCPYCNVDGLCEKLISLSSFSLSWSPPIKDGVRTPVKRIGNQLYDENSYNAARARGSVGKVKRLHTDVKGVR